jgi:hypothetical protein
VKVADTVLANAEASEPDYFGDSCHRSRDSCCRCLACQAACQAALACGLSDPGAMRSVSARQLTRGARPCWAKVEGYGRIVVRDGANAGWIIEMLKDRQNSEFDGSVDCIIIESLHNPIADA